MWVPESCILFLLCFGDWKISVSADINILWWHKHFLHNVNLVYFTFPGEKHQSTKTLYRTKSRHGKVRSSRQPSWNRPFIKSSYILHIVFLIIGNLRALRLCRRSLRAGERTYHLSFHEKARIDVSSSSHLPFCYPFCFFLRLPFNEGTWHLIYAKKR